MFVEILSKFGGEPIRIEAAQLVVRNDSGTPVMVAGEYGPNSTIRVSHGADEDFNQSLRAFGYGQETVVMETVSTSNTPIPAGARRVGGPFGR